jgi:hypothetical protein
MKRSISFASAATFNKEAVARTALLVACLVLVPFAASAADKGRSRSAVAKNDRAEKTDRSAKASRAEKAPAATTTASESTAAPRATKPRVYDFGGLEVEGKLKTPQLLFFRARVKQELDTSTPEKRSFMQELQKSADGKGL